MSAKTTVLSLLSISASAALTHDVGFQLSVNLRHPGKDLPNPVAGLTLAPLYYGHKDELVTASDEHRTVFFVNETNPADPRTWTTNWAAPVAHSYGLSLLADDDTEGLTATAHLRPGAETGGTDIRVSDDGPAELRSYGDWMFCDEPFKFYYGNHFNVLKVRTEPDAPVPENCVQVQLEADCAPIPRESGEDLSHAARVRCNL